jgi:CRP/FNR family transcriptional regulator, cyclic AMP receptor protein
MRVGSFRGEKKPDDVGGRTGSILGLALIRTDLGYGFSGQTARTSPQPAQTVHFDPLYLFHCAAMWHGTADTTSGWELIRGLRSGDCNARAISAALLAKTEDARLLVRDLRRTRSSLHETRTGSSLPDQQNPTQAAEMNTPYGLEIIESCVTCKLRKDKWFCGLSPDVLKAFSAGSHPGTYPGGALLFVEGQMPRGAFVLCSGKVKLSTTSRDGKVLILKVAEAGEVLGLSATISGTCYELTAETAGPCHVNFVERDALLRLMEKSGEMGVHAAQALSKEFQSVYRDIHELVLARSSAGKLARLLLSWTAAREKENGANEVRVRSSMTHEEMAQMIGASRETVTRLLSELKKKEFIRLEGSTLVIRNRTALEALAA